MSYVRTSWMCEEGAAGPTTRTVLSTYTYTYSTSTSRSTYTDVVAALVPDGLCTRAWACDELSAKEDIAGIGVILAFLVTAWAAFGFLAVAYGAGLLPTSLLSPVDRSLFRANSRRCESDWKETLDRDTLLFSDQQLITGLGIMIAGYYEVFANDLDGIHWHTVTYSTWMSSSVHLLTLSLLKEHLSTNRILRNLRLLGMLILLGLLVVAIAPSASPAWAGPWEGQAAVPTRCFFGQDYSPMWQPWSDDSLGRSRYGGHPPFAAILSYLTLIPPYLWKLAQLFDASLRLSKYVRAALEARTELTMKRALLRRSTSLFGGIFTYVSVKPIYLMVCIVQDFMDSFMATILVLLLTLAWGTLQIAIPRSQLPSEVVEAENSLSFGQILPLLLLIQPIVAIITHFAGETPEASPSVSGLLYSACTLSPDSLRHLL